MENKDFIIEQILSIEDFNNVDENLAKIISENDEYRRIFEEYKELSELVSESAPEPKKDGVSLSDAVMDRVRNGDTAPKYINASKFRFPVATVAGLVIISVAAFVAVNANMLGRKDAFESNMNGAIYGAQKNAPMEIMDTSFGILAEDDMYVADEENVEEAEYGVSENAEDVLHNTRVTLYSAPVSQELAKVEYSESEAKAQDKTGDGGYKYSAGTSQNTMYDSAVSEDSITESAAEEETKEADLSEVFWRMEYAKERVAAEKLITTEQIMQLSYDKYIEWFDSIADSPDFAQLYSFENFVQYCNE